MTIILIASDIEGRFFTFSVQTHHLPSKAPAPYQNRQRFSQIEILSIAVTLREYKLRRKRRMISHWNKKPNTRMREGTEPDGGTPPDYTVHISDCAVTADRFCTNPPRSVMVAHWGLSQYLMQSVTENIKEGSSRSFKLQFY